MKITAHPNAPTSGPLTVTKDGEKFVIVDRNGNFYAMTYSGYDADMIAAGPGMLAALNRAVFQLKTQDAEGL